MVSSVQSSNEWQPRFAPHGLKQSAQSEAFELSPESPSKKDEGFAAFGDDGFTLLDAIDIVNPLQHLPMVGTLYREFTGDTLDPFSRVAGSTLFFGPLGTAVSSINVAMEEFTGKDMGGHMMALFKDAEAPAQETEIALQSLGEKTPADVLKPDAAGTDGLDPVTAWAMAELNYRKNEAEKIGITVPDQPYSALIANAAATSQTHPVEIVPPTQWARPIDAIEEPVSADTKDQIAVDQSKTPIDNTAWAMNEFQATHRASPATLLRLKQTTNAYQTIDFPSASSSGTEENHTTSATTNGSLNAQNGPMPLVSDRAAPTRPIAENGTWFSSSMVEALGKYKQAETTDKSRLDQLTSKSSLH